MQLKWLFALVLVVYGFNVFAAEIDFNKLIDETSQDQQKLAQEIRSQLGNQRKTLDQITVSQTVSLEGSDLKVY